MRTMKSMLLTWTAVSWIALGAGACGGNATPPCGNGKLDTGEMCDDGNTLDGDGCSPTCTNECTALHFDGTDYATAANPTSLDTRSVTLAAWYKVAPGQLPQVIAQKKGNPNGGNITYGLSIGPTGLFARLQTDRSPDFLDLSDAAAVPDNKWHHAAVTYSAATGQGTLFLDGTSVATGTKGTGLVASAPATPFSIGAELLSGSAEAYLTGDIADVAIYGTALSSAQVNGLFRGQYPPAPLALYFTQEGAGTVSADASGNGHGLTVPTGGWAVGGPFCRP